LQIEKCKLQIEPEEWAAEQSESANWNFQFAFFIFQFLVWHSWLRGK